MRLDQTVTVRTALAIALAAVLLSHLGTFALGLWTAQVRAGAARDALAATDTYAELDRIVGEAGK